MVILFGSIAVVGMKMCGEVGFSDKNVLILSLSICLGFGLTLVSDFFAFLQNSGLQAVSDLFSNNVLNMFLVAFILSWVLPDDMNFAWHKKVAQDEGSQGENTIDPTVDSKPADNGGVTDCSADADSEK